ncbi:MAG: hypothetical protein N2484_12480 [Clostridia bacterium]|nr:hypothetical protein [Clostridia bacterium]
MNKYQLLESIANSIHAANRIKSLQSQTRDNAARSSIPIDNIALLSEIIQSVAQYSPQNYRSPLSDTSNICRQYCNTYRSFKQHIRSARRQGVNKETFVTSLSILEPVLDHRKKAAIAKIMKIYDLFN